MPDKINPTPHQIADYLTDIIVTDLVKFLIEDYDCTLEEALDKVYNSRTMEILQDEESELYVQSSSYVYEMLIKELDLYPPADMQPLKVAETEN